MPSKFNMKSLRKILIIALAVVALPWYYFTSSDFSYRYRLTLVFDTPDGPKSGSSIHEVKLVDGRHPSILWGSLGGLGIYLKAEAVFVDLGRNKNAVMILYGDPFNGEVGLINIAARALGQNVFGSVVASLAAAIRTARNNGAVFELPRAEVNTIIAFRDLSKSESAEVIFAPKVIANPSNDGPTNIRRVELDRVTEAFGKGYSFKNAQVEFVSPGFWPFNAWPIAELNVPFPQFAFGTPLTNVRANYLPWWNDPGRPAIEAANAAKIIGVPEHMIYKRTY
jgi:hypothetical protein